MLDSKTMVSIMVRVNEPVTIVFPRHEVASKALISIYDHIPQADHVVLEVEVYPIFLNDAPNFRAVNKT